MISGFSIPVKDASASPILVDKDPGVYLGHVTTATNDDGIIYAAYPKWHGIGQAVLKRSLDGGKTWSERIPVPDNWTYCNRNQPIIYNMKDASGRGTMMMFSSDSLPPYRSISEDGGKIWSPLSHIGMPMAGGFGFFAMTQVGPGRYISFFQEGGRGRACTWETAAQRFILLAAGKGTDRRTNAILLVRDENHEWKDINWLGHYIDPPTQRFMDPPVLKPGERWEYVGDVLKAPAYEDQHHEIIQAESNDGGMTWWNPHVIATTSSDKFICEPEVVRSPDGKELTMLLRENTRKYNCHIMQSRDNGATWMEPRELPHGALTGDRHCARYMPDGRLLIAFRDQNANSPTDGGWVAWVGTYEDIVSGKEGQFRLFLGKVYRHGDCGYGGVELTRDGIAVLTTYGRWDYGEMPYIRCWRLDTAALDGLPDMSW